MKETPVLIGPDQRLMGIITDVSGPDRTGVGCLLLNAGVIHRIGPHRINVKIARRLARDGLVSLRLDLSGLGDSANPRRAATPAERTVADLRTGMDFLECERGVRHVVVIGICSGAVDSYQVALADPRVCGVLMFDGYTFPTFKTELVRRWRRVRHVPWRERIAWLRRTATALGSRSPAAREAEPRQGPTAAEFRRNVDALVARGTSVCIAYSHLLEAHNYQRQLQDAFAGAAFLRAVRYHYVPAIDHTVTPIAAQQAFLTLVTSWVAEDVMPGLGRNADRSGIAPAAD